MVNFYSPGKHQKNVDFLTFLGGIDMEHWTEIGYETLTILCHVPLSICGLQQLLQNTEELQQR